MKHAYIVIAVLVLGLVMIVGCFPVDESVDSTAPTRRAIVEKESPVPTAIPVPSIEDFQALEKLVTEQQSEMDELRTELQEQTGENQEKIAMILDAVAFQSWCSSQVGDCPVVAWADCSTKDKECWEDWWKSKNIEHCKMDDDECWEDHWDSSKETRNSLK